MHQNFSKTAFLIVAALLAAHCQPPSPSKENAAAAPTPGPAPAQAPETEAGKIAVPTTPQAQEPAPPPPDYSVAGITPATGDEIVVGGQIALSIGLTATNPPDKVIAFSVLGGQVDPQGDFFVEAPLDEKGNFSVKASKISKLVKALAEAIGPDGSIDRVKLSQALNFEVPPPEEMSDEKIKAFVAEEKARAERGGVAQVLVSMDSKAGDRFAQAQTFQFVGLPFGERVVNGIPVNKAKGNLSLGKISGNGDQVRAGLPANAEAFSLSDSAFSALANASTALKILRNSWINHHPDTKELYIPTPNYQWQTDIATVTGDFSPPTAPELKSWGMYFKVENTSLTFGDICGYQKPLKSIKLVPPADVLQSFGATVTPENPFTNAGAGSAKTESDRISCNGSGPGGFYGAGKDADDKGLMINWGGKGEVPEGYFHFYVEDQKVASFELASTAPYDTDGNLKVMMPSLKVSKDENGKITRMDVKLHIYDKGTKKFEELTDPEGFMALASEFVVGAVERTQSGEFERRYSLLEKQDGGSFVVEAADMIPINDGESGDAPDVWYSHGTKTVPDGARAATSYHVQYDMLGTSYRIEFQEPQVQ